MIKPSSVVLALALLFIRSQADFAIDLTSSMTSTDDEYLAVPTSERVGTPLQPAINPHAPPPPVPFEITSVTFDSGAYLLGDELTYEFTLRYTGVTDITFPVSSQVHLFRNSMIGLRKANITLQYEDALLKNQITDVEALYGSDDVAGSLFLLRNGQSVRVRARGKWIARGLPQSLTSWSRSLQPYVSLQLYYAPTPYGETRSSSGPTIQLTRP